MKTINIKPIYLLLLATLIQGCMPDSLTKFQKSQPTPQQKSVGVVVTDPTGKVIPSANIIYPTFFRYANSTLAQVFEWDVKVGNNYLPNEVAPLIDHNFDGTDAFLGCELDTTGPVITQTLPSGLNLKAADCTISGQPTSITTDVVPPNVGKAIPYTIRYKFKNGKNLAPGVYGTITCGVTECYIASSVLKIGAYKTPVNFGLTQSDKAGIFLKDISTNNLIRDFKIDDGDFTTRDDVITSNVGSTASIQIRDVTSNVIYVQRAIPLTVASTVGIVAGATVGTYDTITFASIAGYVVGDILTAGSYVGTINSISGNTAYIFRSKTSGTSLVAGASITNGATVKTVATVILQKPVRGVVLSSGTTQIRVTQSSDFANIFDVLEPNIAVQSSATKTMITAIDSSDKFAVDQALDLDTQFYVSKANVKGITSFFTVGTTINNMSPIIGANDSLFTTNGVSYAISPALPDGLSFDTTSGIISGSFINSIGPTDYTVTASNPIGYEIFKFKLAASYAPKDLNYSQNQIITVSNINPNPVSVFYEGEKIFQPLKVGFTESVFGKIKRKIGSTKLTIENYNGLFLPGASVDSGRAYVSEKAYISAVNPSYSYNLAFTVGSVASFAIGNYVSSSLNALGKVTYIDAANNILYVQFLTPDTSIDPITFNQGDSLDNSNTYSSAKTTITKLESSYYKLTLGSAPVSGGAFDIGQDVTASNGSTKIGGYVYNIDIAAKNIFVDNVTKTPSTVNPSNIVTAQSNEFMNTNGIDSKERYAGGATTITNVSHENFFVISRGKYINLAPNYTQGSNLTFMITPDLPTGLTLDISAGTIIGTPTYSTTKKDYIITAKNLLGSSSFKFSMEVRDYFQVDEVSGATSFNMHKVGDTQNNRDCKVSAADIVNRRNNDIRCFLEGQEEDFHFSRMKIKALVGSGVCEYVQYAPFSFQQFKPNVNPTQVGLTPATVNYVSGCTFNKDGITVAPFISAPGIGGIGNVTTTMPTSTNKNPNTGKYFCPANYQAYDNTKNYPNCDQSEFNILTYSASLDATGTCVSTSLPTSTPFKCGGYVNNCVKGPIQDILTDVQIKNGNRGLIYSVLNGQELKAWEHKAPIDFSDLTNLRVVNSTLNNQCTSSNTHSNNWEEFIRTSTSNAFSAPTLAQVTTELGKNPFINGVPVYVVNCLDAAYEIKARIRFYTREWDRVYNITDYIDQEKPDSFLAPPGRMNVNAFDTFGINYNNYDDWDNDYTSSLNLHGAQGQASYTDATCGGSGTMPGGGAVQYGFPADEL